MPVPDPHDPSPTILGPAPPAGAAYAFLVVGLVPAVIAPTQLHLLLSPYYLVEQQIRLRGLTCDRVDRISGQRVYRIGIQDVWRFDSDAYGMFIGHPPRTQWRWVYVDPTAHIAAERSWTSI